MIRTKRWNDPKEASDGYRLLVCRYRPRGVSRQTEPWDSWCPELAPSIELLADFHGKHGPPIEWSEYEERYLAEMSSRGFFIRGFAERSQRGETITLLCSSACTDPARCHRTLLKGLLDRAAAPHEKRVGVVRRKKA